MPCITPNDGQAYEDARIISNARFDYKPAEICYCGTEDQIKDALSRGKSGYVRIRSGGHQHEGMSSGDQVLIIDVSKFNTIFINGDVLEVGPGARLKDVYSAVFRHGRLLPGGGCGDVCVGGLVQGGGWGLYSRELGLTCDRLIGFDIVTADGVLRRVTPSGPYSDLFKAVAGGGGGNFGVVTKFRFHLGRVSGRITGFTINWANRRLTADVINDWRNHFPGHPDTRITSFLRATTLAGGASLDQPVIIAGNFLGEQAELESILPGMLPDTFSEKYGDVSYSHVNSDAEGHHVFQHPEYQPGPPAAALAEIMATPSEKKRADLGSTCDGVPFPHKVSSCYPKDDFGDAAAGRLASFLLDSETEKTARRYLSLHSLGGAIANDNPNSSFAFRSKPFLIQYQAWWANKEQKDVERRCIDWVENYRKAMAADTEYSFINFPDRDLPSTDRKTLLEHYYGKETLAELIKVKGNYDKDNLLDFPMGIPRS